MFYIIFIQNCVGLLVLIAAILFATVRGFVCRVLIDSIVCLM